MREHYVMEDQIATIFLGSSTNDFTYQDFDSSSGVAEYKYQTQSDAVIVVRDFFASNMTYGEVEIFETPSKESWIHRVDLFSDIFNAAETIGRYAVYASELYADRLMVMAFSLHE